MFINKFLGLAGNTNLGMALLNRSLIANDKFNESGDNLGLSELNNKPKIDSQFTYGRRAAVIDFSAVDMTSYSNKNSISTVNSAEENIDLDDSAVKDLNDDDTINSIIS